MNDRAQHLIVGARRLAEHIQGTASRAKKCQQHVSLVSDEFAEHLACEQFALIEKLAIVCSRHVSELERLREGES